MRNKILSLLVLLLTAASGAWADDLSNKVWQPGETFNIGDAWFCADDQAASKAYHPTNANHTVPEINQWTYQSGWKQWVTSQFIAIDQQADFGNAGTSGGSVQLCLTPPEDKRSADVKPVGFKIISGSGTLADPYVLGLVYELPAPDVEVLPGEAANTWTFSMPGHDVVLTPIYSAATIYDADGQTEKGSYETFKEAFLAAQTGDVIKLDWDVTVTSATDLMTGNRASEDPVQFTIDFNGHVLDGSGLNSTCINTNHDGDQIRFIDSSEGQTGGLKGAVSGVDNSLVFESGRYNFGDMTAAEIKQVWSSQFVAFGCAIADGKEFVDIENAPDANGFMVYVDYAAIELTIGPKKFATFYAEQDFKVVEGTSIGLYTIMTDGIDLANNQITTSALNSSTIIPATCPTLVYNGGDATQTVKLQVTTETVSQMWSSYFKGTATDKTFTDADMAANDYYVLSGGKAFAPVRGAGTIGAHKCWLQFTKDTSNARSLTLVFENGETTSIDHSTLNIDHSSSAVYDLSGRKVANGQSSMVNGQLKKGVYIKNGQKVVK